MHYLLGLAALVIGAVIATRRTRPTWFVVLTSVLVGVGALLAILSYTRVTDPLGLTANSVLGWTYVGLSLITMLSSIFVLERRGEFGEERPPLIGDNPLDGDTNDRDDPRPGQPHPDFTDAAAARGGAGSRFGLTEAAPAGAGSAASDRGADAASAGAGSAAGDLRADDVVEDSGLQRTDVGGDQRRAGADLRAAADGSPALPSHAGAAAATAAAFGDGIVPTANEAAPAAAPSDAGAPAAFEPGPEAPTAGHHPSEQRAFEPAPDDADARRGADRRGRDTDERPGLSPSPEDGHKASEAAAPSDRPGPDEDAVDGTAVIGADPDISTPPAETDVEAAPEGRADDDREDHGHRA